MPCVAGHYGDLMTRHMLQILIADWTTQSKQIQLLPRKHRVPSPLPSSLHCIAQTLIAEYHNYQRSRIRFQSPVCDKATSGLG